MRIFVCIMILLAPGIVSGLVLSAGFRLGGIPMGVLGGLSMYSAIMCYKHWGEDSGKNKKKTKKDSQSTEQEQSENTENSNKNE